MKVLLLITLCFLTIVNVQSFANVPLMNYRFVKDLGITYHTNLDNFQWVVNNFRNKKTDFLVYFKAGADPTNPSQSWCPDCRAAEPWLQHQIIPKASKLNWSVIIVDIGTPEQWHDPNNKARTDQEFQLTTVPTLFKMHKGTIDDTKTLVESQIESNRNIDALFDQSALKALSSIISEPNCQDCPLKQGIQIFTTAKNYLQVVKHMAKTAWGDNYIVYFKAGVDPQQRNQSWCPDTRAAEGYLEYYIMPKAAELKVPLIIVDVGAHDFWKDMSNPLRHDGIFNPDSVPSAYVASGLTVDSSKTLKVGDLLDYNKLAKLFEG